jgi:hypothetical protein
MSEILTANLNNQEFFFKVITRIVADRSAGTPEQVHIEMYNTPYVFLKKDGQWENNKKNKLKMSNRLINAVIEAINQPA